MKATGEQLVVGDYLTKGRTEKEHLARYRFAATFIRGAHVLDIACGTGYGSHMLVEAGARSVRGVDVSSASISHAAASYGAGNLQFQVGDAQEYRRPDNYDVISTFETIEHVHDYRRTLKNFYDSLVPGGMLVLSTPNRHITSPEAPSLDDRPVNPFHVREFTPDEIVLAVREAGFVMNEGLFGQSAPLRFGNRWVQRIAKRLLHRSKRNSPAVRPARELANMRYIVLVAKKL